MLSFARKIVRKVFPYIFRTLFGLKNIIVLKPHQRFKGNVHALYEYLHNNGYEEKYEIVWYIDGGEEVPETAKVIKTNNIKNNYYYKACAKYIFYENTCPVCEYMKGQRVVYLSHGCPPLKNSKGKVAVKSYNTTDALITSDNLRSTLAMIRQFSEDKMFVCGHPRNDVIFNDALDYTEFFGKKYKKVILWLPTFRKMINHFDSKLRSDSDRDYLYGLPLIYNEDCLGRLNKILEKENIMLIIKPHANALKKGIENINYSNITVWSQEYLDKNGINYYRLFKDTSAFISDYSSVIFDAMLVDKPLAYVIDDIDDYKLGFAYDNVLDYMPGHHIKTLEDMISFFEDVSQDKDIYRDERHRVNAWANEYQDGNNCQRITKIFNM